VPIAARIYGVQAGEPASTIVLATFFLYFRFGGQLEIGAYAATGEYVGALGVTSAREVVGASIHPEPANGLGQGTRIGLEESSGQLVTSPDLEEEGLAWGPLTSAELSTIALKVMCGTPRRFAECFFENRPEHGGGPWRFLEPLQTDSIDYPYNTDNESAYGTGKTRVAGRPLACHIREVQRAKYSRFWAGWQILPPTARALAFAHPRRRW